MDIILSTVWKQIGRNRLSFWAVVTYVKDYLSSFFSFNIKDKVRLTQVVLFLFGS